MLIGKQQFLVLVSIQPHKHIVEKNEALLNLPTLFANSDYLKETLDPKNRKDVAKSHFFRTTIAYELSWTIVHEMTWGEYKRHTAFQITTHLNDSGAQNPLPPEIQSGAVFRTPTAQRYKEYLKRPRRNTPKMIYPTNCFVVFCS